MNRLIALASATALAAVLSMPSTAAFAGGASNRYSGTYTSRYKSRGHRSSRYYRGRPQVRGYRKRRGGYSYSAADTINTYTDSRTLNGGANSYRFELYTRQSRSGPFDHGFFFDSGIGLNGGYSPYMN